MLPVLLIFVLLQSRSDGVIRECNEIDLLEESPPIKGSGYISANNSRIAADVSSSVQLFCQVANPESLTVAWIYKNTRRLLTLQDRSFTQDTRVSSSFAEMTGTWILTINNVTKNDEGIYECQISSNPWERLQVLLKVNDPSEDEEHERPVLMTRDYHEPGWQISSDYLCPDRGRSTKVVILVQSAPNNTEIRSVLRSTWAGSNLDRSHVVLGFFLAAVDNRQVQLRVQQEAHLYGDIIQARFHDHYNNLTLKSIACLEWFEEFCPEAMFLLKADDDLYLNMDNLLKFIDHHKSVSRTIFGNVVYDPKPDRNKDSRYYVSPAIWDKSTYPIYTGGPMYMISGDAVADIHRRVIERPYLFIEDVTITGIGAKLAGVKRRRAPEFFTYNVPSSETCLFRVLVGAHQIPTKDLQDIWRRVHDPNIQCLTTYAPENWEPCIGLKQQESLRHCVLNLFAAKTKQ